MKKEMLINALLPEETRIVIIENGVLEELYIERIANENIVGNIYKGRIVNIEPSIQAAFVDFGIGRNGFLHISDVDPSYWEDDGGLMNQVKQERPVRGRQSPPDRERPPSRGREPERFPPPAEDDVIDQPMRDFLDDSEGADPFAPKDDDDRSGSEERRRGQRHRRGRGRGGNRGDEPAGHSPSPGQRQPQSQPSRGQQADRDRGRSARGDERRNRDRERERDRGPQRGRDRGRSRPPRQEPPARNRPESSPPPRPADLPELEDFNIDADDELRDEQPPLADWNRPSFEDSRPETEEQDSAMESDDGGFGSGLFDDEDSDDEPPSRGPDAVYRRTPPSDDDFGKGLFEGSDEDEEDEGEPEEELAESQEMTEEPSLMASEEDDNDEDEELEPAPRPTQRYDDEDAFAGFADAELDDEHDEQSELTHPPIIEPPTEPESSDLGVGQDVQEGRRRRGRRGRRGRSDEGPSQPRSGPPRRSPPPARMSETAREHDEFEFDQDDDLTETSPGRHRDELGDRNDQGDRGEPRRSSRGPGDRRAPDGRRPGPPGRRPQGQRWNDPRRPKDRPPIQEVFRRGQEVVVQVIKEGIGNKGPTLSTYISIPGRCLVAMPGLSRVGVSRKIVDPNQRRRLRDIVIQLDRPEGVGFIVRTAGMDRSEDELERDLAYLSRLWEVVLRRLKHQPGPAVVYQETDVIIRTIRDIFNQEIDTIYIDEKGAYERAREFMKMVMPNFVERIRLYDEPIPMFNKFHVEEEIIRIQQRTVPLERGGSIVIEQTEALVAIDVNSGNFRAEGNAEETAFQMNLAAAKEIARQLRLRDLGGVIVNDFIDMREERHRRAVENCLRDAVRRDRARTKILRMSAFGLIEMTRQRIRPSLKRSLYRECNTCNGTGHVKTVESMAIDCMRLLIYLGQGGRCRAIHLNVDTPIGDYIQNHKRKVLSEIEDRWRVTLTITGKPMTSPEEVDVHCYDSHGQELDIDVTHLMTRA